MTHLACGVCRGLRQSIIGGLAIAAALCVAIAPADAHRHYHRVAVVHHGHHGLSEGGYSPPYAAIVVDANTGKTLDETSADSPRHPASLTKVMTLYLLFERLDAGKIKLGAALPVSEHASEQAPTKLGLRPGQSIVVEDAIRGIVTRSANDAAVVLAEAIGGDEESFAKMMTAKAHALGMSRTTYVNASGLPDDDQVTTARDQAMLGRAIQERFPRYYTYFSTPSFVFRGEEIRNHNHLVGHVDGVDGIKTGYTRASGFNLLTSLHRGGRHIVAVVLGGASAGARDARMRELIEDHIAEASTQHTATMIAEAAEPAPERVAPERAAPEHTAERPVPATERVAKALAASVSGGFGLASAASQPAQLTTPATAVQAPIAIANKAKPATGSSEPIRPIAVKTIKVKLAPVKTASLAPAAVMIPVGDETGSTAAAANAAATFRPAEPQAKAAEALPPAAVSAPAAPAVIAPIATAPVVAPSPPSEPAAPVRVAAAEPVATMVASAEPPSRGLQVHAAPVHTGWIIQIGAYGSEDEAKQHLDAAQSKAKSLGRADRFTETVTKGDKTLYRARFAGLDKDDAEATCKQLRHSDIACMTVKN